MAKYSLEPQKVDSNTWFYDGKRGITVVHEWRTPDGGYQKTDQFLISWKSIKAALARHHA